METGLLTVLTLAALHAFIVDRLGLCAFWLGLAGLTRPEGMILAVLAWVTTVVVDLLSARGVRWRQLGQLGAAVGVGFIPYFINWALTGTTAAAGMQAKSWWYNVPYYPLELIRSTLHSYRQIVISNFLGWTSAANWYVIPGLLLFSGLGWVALAVQRRWRPLSVTLAWFAVGTLSTATLITATMHLGRYQTPLVPMVVALAACGLAYLWGETARQWPRVLLGLATLILLAFSTYSTLCFARSYRSAVSTMGWQHLTLADWMQENLPAGDRVGITDAGLIRYLGGRPTYDMIGLTTAGAAIPWRHGAGSVFETMEHSPVRPDYFVTYPDVHFTPYFIATDLFAEELFSVEVPGASFIVSPSSVQGIWRADWGLADSGESYYQPDVLARTAGLRLVDTLDIADLNDEADHGVEWWQDLRRPGFPTEVQQLKYRVLPEREVLDGGRLLTGGIAFNVATRPGEPLCLVARLHAQQPGAVQVTVDESDVGHWAYPPLPGQWLETIFWVPAKAVTSSQTRVALEVDTDTQGFLHYAPYYFWSLQGDPDDAPVEVEHRVDATFDDDLALLGFDLPQGTWHPGDMLPVTLYWQATGSTQSGATVFLHLYDSAGDLVLQSDGWAFHGTRPPYTWRPGEAVLDPRSLALPADLTAGRYSMEVGLYNPDGSGRLPAYLNGVRQHEERVPLAAINVEG
jgi:hypothetical protein